jgi:hypothetical protein
VRTGASVGPEGGGQVCLIVTGHYFLHHTLWRSVAPASELDLVSVALTPCHGPVIELIEISQFADAASDQLMTRKLVLWLAPSIRYRRNVDAEMVDRGPGGPLAWAPVQLETEYVEIDTDSLGTTAETHGVWEVIHKDSQTWIEQECRLMGIINQCRYRLLEAECVTRQFHSRGDRVCGETREQARIWLTPILAWAQGSAGL